MSQDSLVERRSTAAAEAQSATEATSTKPRDTLKEASAEMPPNLHSIVFDGKVAQLQIMAATVTGLEDEVTKLKADLSRARNELQCKTIEAQEAGCTASEQSEILKQLKSSLVDANQKAAEAAAGLSRSDEDIRQLRSEATETEVELTAIKSELSDATRRREAEMLRQQSAIEAASVEKAALKARLSEDLERASTHLLQSQKECRELQEKILLLEAQVEDGEKLRAFVKLLTEDLEVLSEADESFQPQCVSELAGHAREALSMKVRGLRALPL